MRLIVTMLVAAVTLIGGHFMNRRWDRALFFLGLAILWGVVSLLLLSWYAIEKLPFDSPDRMGDTFRLLLTGIEVGFALIWLLSLTVTFRNSRRKEGMICRWTASGIMGAVLLTLMTSVVGSGLGFALYRETQKEVGIAQEVEMDENDLTHLPEMNKQFWQYLHFGGLRDSDRELPPPPEGPAVIRGQFLYEGEPAAGVLVKVTLNGRFRTKDLITDRNGIFSLHLPPGEWFVNVIQTSSWTEKPSGETFLLVSGQEDRLEGEAFQRHHWLNSQGLRVEAKMDSAPQTLILHIREMVGVVWPSEKGDERATVADSVLEWEAYPGAEDYLVEISGIRREGRTTNFERLARRRISKATRLPLSAFTTSEGGESGMEYQMQVYAFAKDGSFLAESTGFASEGTFKLSDGRMIVSEEGKEKFAAPLSADEIETLDRNRRYLDTVKVLIEADMLDAAGSLLKRVEGIAQKGRREALSGYLLAKKGMCPAARQSFAEARKGDPGVCIPAEYYQGCGAE